MNIMIDNEWTRFEDILGNLKKFIDQGKIKHVGVSNETPWGLSKYLELSKDKNLPRMLSIQNPYNLLNRTYEVGLAEISIREQSRITCLFSSCMWIIYQENIEINNYQKTLEWKEMVIFGLDMQNPMLIKLLMHIMK